jgi:hypothetical protein
MISDLTPASSSSDAIRAAVARASRVRRRRVVTSLLSRVVPAVAGGLLVAAAIVRFTHAPLAVFWILLAAAAAGVVLIGSLGGRAPAVTDAAAARIDSDANLGGELRSAYWFASRPAPAEAGPASKPGSGAWTAFHLDGAAERVHGVSWPSVYPPVRAVRAWAGSTGLGLAAIALVLSGAWPRSSASTIVRETGTSASATGSVIPSELQQQLDELLKSVGHGALPVDTARARLSDLRDQLSALDPKLQDALAHAMQGQSPLAGNADLKASDPQAADLASRAEQAAADPDLPGDMKWSLQDLASKLAKASRQAVNPRGQTGADAKNTLADRAAAADAPKTVAADTMRMTTAEPPANQMMAAAAGPTGGDPSSASADAARKNAALKPLDLSGVLRKEDVEASTDSAGANVLAEIRRKSEQSHSTLEFSHIAPLAAYDTSHASAPPPPPDALRPLVQQYFIRR